MLFQSIEQNTDNPVIEKSEEEFHPILETPQDDKPLVGEHDKDIPLPQTDQNNITPLNDENVYEKQAQAINDFVNSDLTKIKEDVPLSKDKKIDFSQKPHDDIKSENKMVEFKDNEIKKKRNTSPLIIVMIFIILVLIGVIVWINRDFITYLIGRF